MTIPTPLSPPVTCVNSPTNMRRITSKTNLERMNGWTTSLKHAPPLINNIPAAVLNAATNKSAEEKVGMYLYTIPPTHRPEKLVKVEEDPQGKILYHVQWLDTFSTPHDTGTYLGPYMSTHGDKEPAVN